MLKLLLLCLGAVLLMKLSEREFPVMQNYRESGLHFMGRHLDVYMLLAALWMAAFAFLRTSYNDTGAYIRNFQNAMSLEEGFSSGTYLDWIENPLSIFYRDLLRRFTDNYHIYFLIPAVLQAVGIVKLCKYHSVNPAMSLMLYFCLGTYVMLNLAAFKQGTAMGILLLALPFALRKRYVPYAVLVMIATLFHFYAIVYLLVPLLFGKPWGRTTWLVVLAAVATLLTYESTLGALMAQVDEMGGDIAAEELFDGNSINVLRVAVYWVPGLLALVFRRHVNHNSTRMENLFVNMSILCACVLSIGLAEGANLYGRMAGYFEIAIAIAMPYIIHKIFNRRSERLVSGVATLLFLGYFCYEFAISKNFGANYSAISAGQFLLELIGLR